MQVLHTGHKLLNSTKSIPNTSLKAFMDAFAFMKCGRIWLLECIVVFFTCQLLKYPLHFPDLLMTLKKIPGPIIPFILTQILESCDSNS